MSSDQTRTFDDYWAAARLLGLAWFPAPLTDSVGPAWGVWFIAGPERLRNTGGQIVTFSTPESALWASIEKNVATLGFVNRDRLSTEPSDETLRVRAADHPPAKDERP